jgi:hypothetical protein
MYIIIAIVAVVVAGAIGWKATRKISIWKAIERGDYDLRCPHCNGMAKPMRGTGDKYSCPVCRTETVGPKHSY